MENTTTPDPVPDELEEAHQHAILHGMMEEHLAGIEWPDGAAPGGAGGAEVTLLLAARDSLRDRLRAAARLCERGPLRSKLELRLLGALCVLSGGVHLGFPPRREDADEPDTVELDSRVEVNAGAPPDGGVDVSGAAAAAAQGVDA